MKKNKEKKKVLTYTHATRGHAMFIVACRGWRRYSGKQKPTCLGGTGCEVCKKVYRVAAEFSWGAG